MLAVVLMVTGCTEDSDPMRGSPSTPASLNTEKAGRIISHPERNAYFGDLHLHTYLSFDAAAAGTRTMPEDAYRFARGEAVTYFGKTVRRHTPLDFLAVTDHAEYLGVARSAADADGVFAETPWPKRLAEATGDMLAFLQVFSPAGFRGEAPIPEFVTTALILSNWQIVVDTAQKFYDPGKFTTFVAFEWSPMPGGAHLHRNIIFRGPEFPDRPFSAIDSMDPEDLWTYAEDNREQGIDSVLIPHNSNLSQGLMFAFKDSYGTPLSRIYTERRIENERLVEISQVKGTSETRPEFSPADEFANFELIRFGQEPEFDLAGAYIRPAYRRGLEIQSEVGINPFNFGLVGSSDFHSGISAGEEFNYPGGLGSGDEQSDPGRVLTSVNPLMQSPTTILSAGGLTGIWAEENTRESLFAALKRREVFATSGSRIRVRLFAGWDYPDGITRDNNWILAAYDSGVPMGADLPNGETTPVKSPRLLLQAVKDPDGGNLDRIQVIKLWYYEGVSHEQVYDAVWAGDRGIDSNTGHLPAIGNTVDRDTANYTNTLGATELIGEWMDPDFIPEAATIYYARVLEIPTPRWSTYLAVRNGLPLSKDVPPTIQERAWTSPVFYTPGR